MYISHATTRSQALSLTWFTFLQSTVLKALLLVCHSKPSLNTSKTPRFTPSSTHLCHLVYKSYIKVQDLNNAAELLLSGLWCEGVGATCVWVAGRQRWKGIAGWGGRRGWSCRDPQRWWWERRRSWRGSHWVCEPRRGVGWHEVGGRMGCHGEGPDGTHLGNGLGYH